MFEPTLSNPHHPDLQLGHYTVLGAGKSGMAAVMLLRALNLQVALLDNDPDHVDEEARRMMDSKGSAIFDSAARLPEETQALVLSPGVSIDHRLAKAARDKNLRILGELELASLAAPGERPIAVTGTNGKTTVTMMIDTILREAGMHPVTAGNIGLPWSRAILENPEPEPNLHWILEVSSFQLETIRYFHPHVAILLNITPDHLDRHGTIEHYADLKGRITENQDENDVLIINQDDSRCLKIARDTRARVLKYSTIRPVDEGCYLEGDLVMFQKAGMKPKRLFSINHLQMEGLHNISNAMAAACAAYVMGAGRKKIASAIKGFSPNDHRMQYAGKINDVRYINDSKATNIDAMLSAVKSFNGQVHLIAGGHDKNSPFILVAEQLAGRVKAAWLIGEAANIIKGSWSAHVSCQNCITLEVALEESSAAAMPGDVVLLSPGCASFDQFDSYVERGEFFCKWVASYQQKTGCFES